jgi:hypothetical protein
MAYHALGREKESDATLRELIEKFHANAAWSIASVYALRNQRDEAFKWLDRAYAQHDGGLIFIKIEPLLKNLRSDSRICRALEEAQAADPAIVEIWRSHSKARSGQSQ